MRDMCAIIPRIPGSSRFFSFSQRPRVKSTTREIGGDRARLEAASRIVKIAVRVEFSVAGRFGIHAPMMTHPPIDALMKTKLPSVVIHGSHSRFHASPALRNRLTRSLIQLQSSCRIVARSPSPSVNARERDASSTSIALTRSAVRRLATSRPFTDLDLDTERYRVNITVRAVGMNVRRRFRRRSRLIAHARARARASKPFLDARTRVRQFHRSIREDPQGKSPILPSEISRRILPDRFAFRSVIERNEERDQT